MISLESKKDCRHGKRVTVQESPACILSIQTEALRDKGLPVDRLTRNEIRITSQFFKEFISCGCRGQHLQ